MSHERLLPTESHWPTKRGKAHLSDKVIMHGKDLHRDLGTYEWHRLYLYSIFGRDPGDSVAKMLNFFWVATSYPDPSIWPNHVAALAASARATASTSLLVGLAVSEATIFGRRPEVKALNFFYRAGQWCDKGGALSEFIEREKSSGRILYGYGRPLAKTDERIAYTLEKAKELDLDGGRYLRMAFEVHRYLDEHYGYSMNVAAVNAALSADMGLSCEEFQLYASPAFLAGMVPCYQDARERPEGAFFPVRCSSLIYDGPAKRDWEEC